LRRHHPIRCLGALALVAACGGGEGHPDKDLKGLVHAEKTEPAPIDVARATEHVDELQRALGQPHRQLRAAFGAHKYRATSSLEVLENSQPVEQLDYESSIEVDAKGNYHAVVNNSKEYGREILFVDGLMYLRPRYQPKFHKRPPADEAEPERLLGEIIGELGAYFDVVAGGAELVDRGHVDFGGRSGRKIEIKTAPEPSDRPAQKHAHKMWRDDVVVREVVGQIVLDEESGCMLAGEVRGVAVFSREARQFEMKLTASSRISDIGAAAANVAAPPAEQTVPTPEHHREAFERERLLRGIAPPARKAPTPATTDGAGAKKRK
jgi:hypothetical protein